MLTYVNIAIYWGYTPFSDTPIIQFGKLKGIMHTTHLTRCISLPALGYIRSQANCAATLLSGSWLRLKGPSYGEAGLFLCTLW
jgi:hypothetical protein